MQPRNRRIARGALRAVFWMLGATLLFSVLAVAAVLVLVHHLDDPAIRDRILRAVREKTGIALEYDRIAVAVFEGVTIEGVRVLAPEPWDRHSPVLASVGRIEASWEAGSFWRGAFRLSRVALSGIRVTLVQDEQGRSSLNALLDALPKTEPKKGAPLSAGVPIRGLGVVVDEVEVRDVSFVRLTLRDGQVARTESLSGIEVHGSLQGARAPESLEVTLSSASGAATRLEVRETAPDGAVSSHAAEVHHRTTLQVQDPLQARLEVEVSDGTQDFSPSFPLPKTLARARMEASFHPEESRIHVAVSPLEALDGLANGALEADLWDAPDAPVLARVAAAELHVDLDKVPESVRNLFAGLTWRGAALDLEARGVDFQRRAPAVWVRDRVEARFRLDEAKAETAVQSVAVRAADLQLTATQAESGSVQADLKAGFERIRSKDPARTITLRDGTLGASVVLRNLAEAVLGTVSGDARITAGIRVASVRTGAGRVRLERLEADVTAPVALEPPYRAEGALGWSEGSFIPKDRPPAPFPAARATWSVRDLQPDPEAPARTAATVVLNAHLGDLRARMDLAKRADDAQVQLELRADSLAPVAAFVQNTGLADLRIPWPRIGARLNANAVVTGLARGGARHLELTADTEVSGLQASLAGHRLEVPSLKTSVQARGPMDAPAVSGTVNASGVQMDGHRLSSVSLAARARAARSSPEVEAEVQVDGRHARILKGSLKARVAGRSSPAVEWSSAIEVAHLSELRPLLPAGLRDSLDLKSFEAAIETSGTLSGVLDSQLRPVRAARAAETARGTVQAHLRLRGLGYRSEGLEVDSPEVRADLDAARGDGPFRVSGRLASPAFRLDQRVRRFEVQRAEAEMTVESAGTPESGEVKVGLRAAVGELRHDQSASYPVGEVSWRVAARVLQMQAVRVDEFVFENPNGGTRLDLTAALDDLGGRLPKGPSAAWELVMGRRALSVSGTLEQRLDALRVPDGSLRGMVRIPFRVQSGDRSLYRVTASIETRDVSLRAQGGRLEVARLNGSIPIEEEVAIGPEGRISLITEQTPNLFSRVRFADQHPYLRTGGFAAMDRVVVGPLDVGPVAGNFRIARNVVSLDQMEAVFQGGKVVGQLIMEWRPSDPIVSFRGKVTGVKAGATDERLDANAALDLNLGRRELEGRIHLVRIGRGHLLDLMDAWDPYQENVSANRIRKALKYGYPKYARVRMNGGFLSAKIELGGLGSLVRIDEIRGIPTGPLLEKYLSPLDALLSERAH